MKNYTEEELREKYKRLPEEIKEAMFGDDMDGALENLAARYGLAADTIDDIEDMATMVMFGLIRPEDFAGSISKLPGVGTDIAARIEGEINEKVFRKIRGALSLVSAAGKYENPEMAPRLNALPGRILIQGDK